MDARAGKFGEHERSVGAESNSSFLRALQTSQVQKHEPILL